MPAPARARLPPAARRTGGLRAAAQAPRPRARRAARAEAAAGGKTAVITGASSGLGLNAANALAQKGWHVVCAVRDFAKMEMKARDMGFPEGSYTVMHCDLASQASVRAFAEALQRAGTGVDALVCNAALYLPAGEVRYNPQTTADGFELTLASNHLGHFRLVHELFPLLKASADAGRKPRCVILGSVTGNTNTVAGQVPPKADLGDLSGLADLSSMVDKSEFDGAKAYKDSKVCNMLTMRQLHDRFHEGTGIQFASLYPGCIADTNLFRNHTNVFRTLFPLLQKNLTKGYVSNAEAGARLATIVDDPELSESGVYWSWRGGGDDLVENYNATDRTGAYKNEPSEEVKDDAKAKKLFDLSMKACGIEEFGAPAPVGSSKAPAMAA